MTKKEIKFPVQPRGRTASVVLDFVHLIASFETIYYTPKRTQLCHCNSKKIPTAAINFDATATTINCPDV